MIKNFFLDFDGVIAESLEIKTQAFFDLYKPYGGEIARKVVSHHINNAGVSRFEKLKYYHQEYLKVSITDSEFKDLLEKFSNLVLQKIINCEFVPGVLEFLKKYSKTKKIWIISATPIKEMRIIAKSKKIETYFVDIYGSPNNKDYWTNTVIRDFKLNCSETVFVGDALSDFQAAQNNAIQFILREHNENTEIFKKYSNIIRISSFKEIEEVIKI